MKIAGKTGTSQKLVDGQYSKKSYTASFIGYFPAEDPQIVIAVIIDAPKSGSYYGGSVSAPIFKRIAERIIALGSLIDYSSPENYMQGDPDVVLTGASNKNNFSVDNSSTLNLADFEIGDAVTLLKESSIPYEIEGPKKNAIVVDQKVTWGNSAGEIKKVVLITKNAIESKTAKDKLKMPDVKGLSMRKCVKVVSSLGLDYKINGSGRVVNQVPEPGAVLSQNEQIVISCDNTN
jgi:hypothetical protein